MAKIGLHLIHLLASCIPKILRTTAFSARPIARNRNIRMQSTANNEAESSTMTRLNGISSPEVQKHTTFLLDMWGVMHDGSKPYEGVLETVQQLKREGKKLVILSNSSKRREDSENMLRKREF